MRRPLLIVTRPAEEAGRTCAAAQEAGFATLVAPLLTIRPLAWEPGELPQSRHEAILFTSARSPRLVAAACPALTALPVYAVGARTADIAAEAGFHVVAAGEADGSAVLSLAARDGVRTILHLAGKTTAALHVPAGLTLVRRAVYAANRVDALGSAVLDALGSGSAFAVLLFSARTARRFAQLADRSGIARSSVRLIALSPAVADAAGPGWRDVAVAARPGLAETLAAARSLWQGAADG
ncbi:MAG: uroporphyrinogen-III synthase [Sandarakinorhabdus sp.]|nr:uroporphyrinogen-III synthase [Sandarakinorhabdus sp.]